MLTLLYEECVKTMFEDLPNRIKLNISIFFVRLEEVSLL